MLQLSYTAGEAKYGVIFSVDGRGSITWHMPAGYRGGSRSAPALDAQGQVVLPSAYELDDAPAFERFFLVYSSVPFDVGDVERAARALSSPAGRRGQGWAGSSRRPGSVLRSVEETGVGCMSMKKCLAAILLGVVAWAAVAEAPVPLRRFALVAGSNDGGAGSIRLKYAETDARSFAAVLQELGGVRAEDMVLLATPNLSRFQDGLDRVAQMVKSPREMDERREFVVYYSGHSDDDGLILGKDRFPWEDLRREINGISADVKVAILDSCSSGSLTRAKGGVARPAFLFDASADMKGYAFLTSASAEEAAQESDRIGASFFTHFLISGLRGAADTMGNGVVTLNEAYAFAFKETLASTENTQYGPSTRRYDISLTGTGDLVLTDLRSATSGLTVAEEVGGRLFITGAWGLLALSCRRLVRSWAGSGVNAPPGVAPPAARPRAAGADS